MEPKSSLPCSQEPATGPLPLTPWSRVLFDKLTVAQLVQKFPAFYETIRFTRARRWSLLTRQGERRIDERSRNRQHACYATCTRRDSTMQCGHIHLSPGLLRCVLSPHPPQPVAFHATLRAAGFLRAPPFPPGHENSSPRDFRSLCMKIGKGTQTARSSLSATVASSY